MRQENVATSIQVRVSEILQFFDASDPCPYRERNLDTDAEEYIVGQARELPKDSLIRTVVHLPEAEAASNEAGELAGDLTWYFGHRADLVRLELRELFRVGRKSIVIGLPMLAICLAATQALASRSGTAQVHGIVQESLVILGWRWPGLRRWLRRVWEGEG